MKLSNFLIVFLLIFAGCKTKNSNTVTENGVTTVYGDIQIDDFAKMQAGDQDFVLIDVRTPEEIADGKLDGAMEIDFKAEGFADKLNELDKDQTFVVYCRSGARSANTCTMMQQFGFEKVYNLYGGYKAYKEQIESN